MITGFIVNPKAGSAEGREKIRRLIEREDETRWWETAGPDHAADLAREALEQGIEQIVIVGGDGTVNEVVNGVLDHQANPRLGVIPLGTGNDLARTLAIPPDPESAFELLTTGREEPIDVIEVSGEGISRYCVNVAAGGFSGQVDEMLDQETKAAWGPLAYLFGAANVLPDLQNYSTSITYEDERVELLDVLNIVVANGRTAGGGKRVAPMADPQDGLLDIVVIEQCTTAQLAEVAVRLFSGTYQDSPHVHHRRSTTVHVRATPGMWFNVDGELLTKKPLTFTNIPGALRFVVGAEYRTSPIPERARRSDYSQ